MVDVGCLWLVGMLSVGVICCSVSGCVGHGPGCLSVFISGGVGVVSVVVGVLGSWIGNAQNVAGIGVWEVEVWGEDKVGETWCWGEEGIRVDMEVSLG